MPGTGFVDQLKSKFGEAVSGANLENIDPWIEVTPAGHMVFFTYVDRPGIIGKVGTLLGEAGVNIATMDVGRKAEGGEALMCLTVDTEVPPEVLEGVADEIEAHQLRTVTLPPA